MRISDTIINIPTTLQQNQSLSNTPIALSSNLITDDNNSTLVTACLDPCEYVCEPGCLTCECSVEGGQCLDPCEYTCELCEGVACQTCQDCEGVACQTCQDCEGVACQTCECSVEGGECLDPCEYSCEACEGVACQTCECSVEGCESCQGTCQLTCQCSVEGGETVYYTVTLGVSPSGSGTVSGGGTYESGSNVIIKATAATGYQFEDWYRGTSACGWNATHTISSINQSYSLQAVFNKLYTLSYIPNGGTTTPSSVTNIAGYQFYLASAISRNNETYTTDTGTVSFDTKGGSSLSDLQCKLSTTRTYTFNYWSGSDGSVNQPGAQYTMPAANRTMTAQWDYTDVPTQVPVLLPSATGRSRYIFKGWDTNSAGTSVVYQAGYSYYFANDITLYAVWEAESTYAVSGSPGTGVSSVTGSGSYYSDETATLTATLADPSYSAWSVGEYQRTRTITSYSWPSADVWTFTAGSGTCTTSSKTITDNKAVLKLTDFSATVAVTATASSGTSTQFQYICTATAGTGISSASCALTSGGTWSEKPWVDPNTSVTWTCTVSSGYTFTGWYDKAAGSICSTDTTYVASVSRGRILTATAEQSGHKVTISKQPHSDFSDITLSGGGEQLTSATLTCSFTNSNYIFNGWYTTSSATSSPASTANPWTISSISSDLTYYARVNYKWTSTPTESAQAIIDHDDWNALGAFINKRTSSTVSTDAEAGDYVTAATYNEYANALSLPTVTQYSTCEASLFTDLSNKVNSI